MNNSDTHNPMAMAGHPAAFYQNNWDPDFSCHHDTKVGVGDGGKWVCDPHLIVAQSARGMEQYNVASQNNVSAGCLLYSVGSAGNFLFEEGMFNILGQGVCEIHTFDFTEYLHHVPIGKGIFFHQWLSSQATMRQSRPVVEVLDNRLQKGHSRHFRQPRTSFGLVGD